MIKLSSVFTSVIRFADTAPLPSVSYSFIDTFCRWSSSFSLILNVIYLDIFVNIFVTIELNKK